MTLQIAKSPVRPITLASSRVEELEQRVAELTLAVEARDTFIAVAGHELRNPMTPIEGQIDLLLTAVSANRASPAQVVQRLRRIQQAVRHYVERAVILLDVSRINAGNMRLKLEPFDLVPVLQQVADDYTETARRVGVRLSVIVPGCLVITSDRLALEQVTDKLISNAIKYGAGTPVGIMASLQEGRVRIEVHDGGPGVCAADRERVFGRFERAVGRSDQHSGFGVGLWIVGQLVAAMGGKVTVDDAPGGGARFTVSLPEHVERALV